MKPEYKRFAPAGLILFIISVVICASYFFLVRQFDLYLQIGLAVSVLGLALFVILDPDSVRKLFSSRNFKYGSFSFVIIIVLLAVVVLINLTANKYNIKWDFTEDKQNSLTSETINTIAGIPESINALAFFTADVSKEQATLLLNLYKQAAAGKFDYTFIDPESNPVVAQQFNVTKNGTVILTMGERSEPVNYLTEVEVTTAIIKLLNPTQHVVYFLTGHGEHDLKSTDETSYSSVVAALTSRNFLVNELNLMATSQIPQDAEVIVIAGPTKQLSRAEVDLLKSFVESGRSLFVLENPVPMSDFGNAADPVAEYLQNEWGIILGQDVVMDPNSQNPNQAVSQEYSEHPIVDPLLKSNMVTVFPYARSVQTVEAAPANITFESIINTAENSWGETDFKSLNEGEVNFEEGKDLPGPVSLAVAANNSVTNGRIVVIGNSFFAINNNFTFYGNGDLMMNSITWLAGDDKLINLTPHENIERLVVPPQSVTVNALLLVSVFVIPMLILVTGIIVYTRKKKMG